MTQFAQLDTRLTRRKKKMVSLLHSLFKSERQKAEMAHDCLSIERVRMFECCISDSTSGDRDCATIRHSSVRSVRAQPNRMQTILEKSEQEDGKGKGPTVRSLETDHQNAIAIVIFDNRNAFIDF